MFRHEAAEVLIPQKAHAQLAAELASAWGNSEFEKPMIDFASFVEGVLSHDDGYGENDINLIGGSDIPTTLRLIEANFSKEFDDPTVTAIVKFHNVRLASYGKTPEHKQLYNKLKSELDAYLGDNGLEKETFERIDRIVDLLDSISFDFSHGETLSESNEVFAKDGSTEQTEIHYDIDQPRGVVKINPWPFSVDEIEGELIAYQPEGYPDTLVPVKLQFKVRPKDI